MPINVVQRIMAMKYVDEFCDRAVATALAEFLWRYARRMRLCRSSIARSKRHWRTSIWP